MKDSKTKIGAASKRGPLDMTAWGQEKSEALLSDIVRELQLLDDYEGRAGEHGDRELLTNTRANLAAMAWNVTKIYAFFCDGQWEPRDRDTLVEEREVGLDRLKKTYASNESRPDGSDYTNSLF